MRGPVEGSLFFPRGRQGPTRGGGGSSEDGVGTALNALTQLQHPLLPDELGPSERKLLRHLPLIEWREANSRRPFFPAHSMMASLE
jgi:hypothetical protein